VQHFHIADSLLADSSEPGYWMKVVPANLEQPFTLSTFYAQSVVGSIEN